jgi:hypothetical protein
MDELITCGERPYGEGYRQKAKERFLSALNEHPYHPKALHNLGVIFFLRSDRPGSRSI